MAAKKKTRKRHNLGGVAMEDETWALVHQAYARQRRPDETFAAWVRRKLQS
jgi:predicted branched-subunit amino acid permease